MDKVIFPNGTETWGNGNSQNIPFETDLTYLIKKGGLILDIGCGQYKVHESCLGVDAYADNNGVNVKAYMWDMPFEDASVDTIFCFQALEHISKYQVLPSFNEFARILKPQGFLLLLVPDLLWVLKTFIDNPTVDWNMDMIFGTQTHEGEYHRTGFTGEILIKYLIEIDKFDILQEYIVNAYNQQNIGLLLSRG